ncbi:efflux RND transporter periplasmic adaptor subunit [Lichenibacterium dinghuense]|uniref:efflux RND transporter periplasmic adaptor subunit n=1 Tax=Lichenibacterium dinghuense TaxID=2895977 RepID=UPI001EFFD181|nr:efflux RND transporter periplasmic adaptor subunit [Lichenibacterium sp. 6Y81]
MQRKGVIGIAAVTAVLLLVAGYAWHAGLLPNVFGGGDGEAQAAPKPVPVHVLALQERAVPVSFDYTATVVSPQIAELKPRVTGAVLERGFAPGSRVAKGDLLFQIDPRPFEAALAEAQGQQAQAQASLDFASAEVERFAPLAKKGFASDERIEQVTRDRDTAAGQLRQDEANVARQKLNIDYAAVRAPFTGQAGLTDVNVGDLANADQTQLVSLAQTDPIQVQVALSASDVDALRSAMAEGRKPDVQLLGADGQPSGKTATVEQFDNAFNPRTSRLNVRAGLPNPDGSLVPGQFLRIRLTVGTRQRLLVPTKALSAELNQQIVYAVKDGVAHPQPVETGEAYGDDTAVLDGLHPGMSIAVDNLQKLKAGTKVDATPEAETTATR